MFPNEKARLMRMMDGNGIPAFNAAGMKMDFTQRVEWLIGYANQQLRAADVVSPAEEKEYLEEMNKVASELLG